MAGKARLYRSNSYTPDDSNTDVFDTDFRYSSSVHHQKVRQRSKSYVENKTVFSRPTANRSKSYGDVNLSHFNKNITYIWKSALFSKYDIHVYSDAKKSIDAPDGGWGWLILLSSFVIQFIVIGEFSYRSLKYTFVQFIQNKCIECDYRDREHFKWLDI